MTPLPLILDSVVACALEERLHVDIARLARVNRAADGRISSVGWYPDGYVRYVKLMNDWASALHCRADSIEMFLFGAT